MGCDCAEQCNREVDEHLANQTQVGGVHYKQFDYETWDVIVDWDLGYLDGNVVKYLSRWRHKHEDPEKQIEDLKKARHYLDKLIEIEEQRLEDDREFLRQASWNVGGGAG